MLPELTQEELSAGLDRVAAEVLDEAGFTGPRPLAGSFRIERRRTKAQQFDPAVAVGQSWP